MGDDIIDKSEEDENSTIESQRNTKDRNHKNNVTKSQKPQKGYYITDACIGCGKCLSRCPQMCIDEGKPFSIRQSNCLHCGACFENCPVQAIQRVG